MQFPLTESLSRSPDEQEDGKPWLFETLVTNCRASLDEEAISLTTSPATH
jgi:hypothetical protein